MKDALLQGLKPLYVKLLEIIPSDYCTFCVQWGQNFPQIENNGIVFVGRAVNSWVDESASRDIDVLFNESGSGIFSRKDQMGWVDNLEGNTNGYNTRKSAFWRVIKGVAENYYPKNWFNNVAWSNLCKASPYEGWNPANTVYYDTIDINRKILLKEIEILSPKIVVMLTGRNWAVDFVKWLNSNANTKSIAKREWGDYEAKLYKIKDQYIIVTEHPMKKKENSHIKAIISLIDEANRISCQL